MFHLEGGFISIWCVMQAQYSVGHLWYRAFSEGSGLTWIGTIITTKTGYKVMVCPFWLPTWRFWFKFHLRTFCVQFASFSYVNFPASSHSPKYSLTNLSVSLFIFVLPWKLSWVHATLTLQKRWVSAPMTPVRNETVLEYGQMFQIWCVYKYKNVQYSHLQ